MQTLLNRRHHYYDGCLNGDSRNGKTFDIYIFQLQILISSISGYNVTGPKTRKLRSFLASDHYIHYYGSTTVWFHYFVLFVVGVLQMSPQSSQRSQYRVAVVRADIGKSTFAIQQSFTQTANSIKLSSFIIGPVSQTIPLFPVFGLFATVATSVRNTFKPYRP